MKAPALRFAPLSMGSLVMALAAIAIGVLAVWLASEAPRAAPFLALTFFVGPLAALAYSIFACVYVRKRGTPGDISLSRYGVILAGGWILLLFFSAVSTDSTPSYRRGRSVSKNNLKQIGLAILMYANDCGGAVPPDLQTLHDTRYAMDPTLFRNPEWEMPDFNERRIDATGGYFYCRIAGPHADSSPPNTPVVFEKKVRPRYEGVNVLYIDGRVTYTPLDDLERLLEKYADLYETPPVMPEAIEQ